MGLAGQVIDDMIVQTDLSVVDLRVNAGLVSMGASRSCGAGWMPNMVGWQGSGCGAQYRWI